MTLKWSEKKLFTGAKHSYSFPQFTSFTGILQLVIHRSQPPKSIQVKLPLQVFQSDRNTSLMPYQLLVFGHYLYHLS